MNTFTIRDIENLSGIKAHTLRVWEQRYGIIRPMRKDSNHRLYGIEDLKQILRISFLYNQGYKISRIAEMGEEEIKKLSLELKPKGNYEVFINQLMEASMDFDEDLFRNVMDNAMVHLGMEKLMTQVIYPFLNKVGVLWMTGNVIPSQEHFASNIIRNKILMATNQLPPKQKVEGKKYILFNPPGEYHEIPLLFVQYCLKQRGISTVLFGIDTSTEMLKEYLRKNRSTHLFLFMTTNFTNMQPVELLEDIKRNFPGLKIEVAGNSFRGLQAEIISGIRIFSSVEDFTRHLGT
jgi:MerR family transcriptional regulator, light-induced transcriptional regulator